MYSCVTDKIIRTASSALLIPTLDRHSQFRHFFFHGRTCIALHSIPCYANPGRSALGAFSTDAASPGLLPATMARVHSAEPAAAAAAAAPQNDEAALLIICCLRMFAYKISARISHHTPTLQHSRMTTGVRGSRSQFDP